MPDYDINWKGDTNRQGDFKYAKIFQSHSDLKAFSNILNTTVSFYWRPVIDKELMLELRKWSQSRKETPPFILIGIVY